MCRSNQDGGKTPHGKLVYRILYILLFLAFLVITGDVFAQQTADSTSIISGTVTDGSGAPLELVNIRLEGTTSGTVTDSSGIFSFRTHASGEHTIVASIIGFESKKDKVILNPGETLNWNVTLQQMLQKIGELQVTASSFRTGETEGVTLNPLEVVTTPGASADLFRTIKTFPGVSTVDQGAGLFVRGGDVSETKILLDQATVVHPYRFESPTGGARGTIPPFLVSGTYFSTGGFPARYGNALSAVL